MARHAWLGHADPNDQRMALLQSANDELRQKLTDSLTRETLLLQKLAEAQAVELVHNDPKLAAMRERLEHARDFGSWTQRRWAKQILGEA